MYSFLSALLTQPFLQYALLTGVLAGVACGVVGVYVTVRRISSIAGAISHSILGGRGVALYLPKVVGLSWFHPLLGALAAGLFSALLIGWVTLRAKQREDTVIGAIWAVGMAVGILFIYRTPGYNQDLMSYLFGNILLVTPRDLWVIAGLDLVVLALAAFLHRPFQAICFDEEFARLRGLPVDFLYILLLCLAALTVVVLVSVVGIIMVIALLTLPAATAGLLSKTMGKMMVLSVLFCICFTAFGLAVSYEPDLPPGATIIVVSGGAFILTLALRRVWEVVRGRRLSR